MIVGIILWFFLLIILILSWIIFVPVTLLLDTRTQKYLVYQPFTFSAAFTPFDTHWLKMRVFGISLGPFKASEKSSAKKRLEKKAKPKAAKSFASNLKLLKRFLRSLTIKKLTIDLDSGDVVTNAKLYPPGITGIQWKKYPTKYQFRGTAVRAPRG